MSGTACLVCGTDAFEPHGDILLRCPACGFVTARFDESIDARHIYDGNYFTGDEYLDYRADEALFRRTFRRRLGRLRRIKPHGRLLEIGAAYGFFLDLAREHYDAIGFEINPQAARFAREHLGADVRTDDFLEARAEDLGARFDLVVMWDVIEHLQWPDRYLAHVAELTNPGAVLCLTTGDIGSPLARLRGRKWRLIHPPTHLHYFDRRTIARLLANHGFRVREVRSVGVARSVRQILYSILVLGFRMPRAYGVVRKTIPAGWGLTLNTFDIMQVTAQKAETPPGLDA